MLGAGFWGNSFQLTVDTLCGWVRLFIECRVNTDKVAVKKRMQTPAESHGNAKQNKQGGSGKTSNHNKILAIKF